MEVFVNGLGLMNGIMVASPRIAEARLKAAVIDRLCASAHVPDDAVLISEMTVANWSRRADLVLANGCLWAFEIKSEVDSLARLPGQLDTFRRYFEKLTIVVASRFEDRVTKYIPDGVGLWVAESNGRLVERLRPKFTILSPEASISLMTARELRRLLLSWGRPITKNTRRADLVSAAMGLSSAELASAARQAVKARHRSRHEALFSAKVATGTLTAIMSRRGFRTPVRSPEPGTPNLARILVPPDHPERVIAPVGPILRRRRASQSPVSSSSSPLTVEKSDA